MGVSKGLAIKLQGCAVLTISIQREIEHRTLIFLAFSPDAAAVPVDDAFDGGQADARSGEIQRRVQPLKGAKKLLGVSQVKKCRGLSS